MRMKRGLYVGLSGSGFLCPAEAGALQACEAAGMPPSLMSLTSGGAIVGVIYAALREAGRGAEDLTSIVLDVDWQPLMDFTAWSNLWRLATSASICDPKPLEEFLLHYTRGLKFKDLSQVDLRITAFDSSNQTLRVFSVHTDPDMLIGVAARRSSSLPFVYPDASGKYMDGGIMRNLPANLLPDEGVPRYCVVLNTNGKPNHRWRMCGYQKASAVVNGLMNGQQLLDRLSAPGVEFVDVECGALDALDATMPVATRHLLIEAGSDAMSKALTSAASL